MTITVTIKNDGPHPGGVMYYDEARQIKPHVDTLLPGESITMNVWNGHIPMILPYAPAADEPKLFRCPPATTSLREA